MANNIGTNRPAVGALVLDGRRQKVGRVMDHIGTRVQLRPPQGGREWDCRPEDIETVDRAQLLSAKVAAANAQSEASRW